MSLITASDGRPTSSHTNTSNIATETTMVPCTKLACSFQIEFALGYFQYHMFSDAKYQFN